MFVMILTMIMLVMVLRRRRRLVEFCEYDALTSGRGWSE